MRLRGLLEAAGVVPDSLLPPEGGSAAPSSGGGDERDPDVTGVSHDSRGVSAGDLFCCVPGASHDGHDHAAAAVAAGAVALLVERPLGVAVTQVVVPSVREAMGPLSAAAAGHPARRLTMIGVTGTNGKTTTVHLLGSILRAAGRPCAVLGTLSGVRTTAEAPELQAELARLADGGTEAVAMEVSSHALAQHRVDGTRFDVAVFTNLSPDHLDFHPDLESYFEAKARLFTPELSRRAVVDLDDPRGLELASRALVPTEGYSLADADGLELGPTGSRFRWRGQQITLALPGRFNVANALAAATAAAALGVTPDEVAAGVAALGAVPGRMERVDAGQPFTVLVDYAHTPDGITEVLTAARELAGPAAVHLVFGCGGDRDAAKRPLMGAAAIAGADDVIVTTDNSRSEDPAAIAEAVLAGARQAAGSVARPGALHLEADRREAITRALASARPGDVVVVAGKGHETVQEVGGAVVAFDDRAVATQILGELGHRGEGGAP